MGELLLKQATKISIAEEVHAGVATGGAASSITLAAGASAVDDYYNNKVIEIVSGTGIGQKRYITDYNGTSKVATVNAAWDTQPVNGTGYEIPLFGVEPTSFTNVDILDANPQPARELLPYNPLRNTFDKGRSLLGAESTAYDLTIPLHGAGPINAGTAQAGAADSITLATTASAVADYYNGKLVKITGGTGSGQTRLIADYSTGRVADVAPDWTITPDNTSTYEVLGDVPETDALWKCLFGRKRLLTALGTYPLWPAITSSAGAFTVLTMDDADDLSIFAVSDLVLIISGDGTGGEVRRITAIDDTAPGKSITLSQGCSADPTGKYIKGGIQYQIKLGVDAGLRGLPSFFCRFLRGGIILEKFAGNKINNGRIEWTSGQIVNVVLGVEGQRRTSAATGTLTGNPADADVLPHIARWMHVFIGGISYPLSNVFVQLANTLFRQTAITTSGTQNLIRTAREVTGGFGLLYEEDHVSFETVWDAQTLAELLLVSSKGDADLTPGNVFAVCMPQIKYTNMPKSEESGIYKLDGAFEAVYVSGEDTIYAAML